MRLQPSDGKVRVRSGTPRYLKMVLRITAKDSANTNYPTAMTVLEKKIPNTKYVILFKEIIKIIIEKWCCYYLLLPLFHSPFVMEQIQVLIVCLFFLFSFWLQYFWRLER